MILDQAELVEITKRLNPSAQARVLRALGIPFKIHPSDGCLLVDRETARVSLGAKTTNAANDEPKTYDIRIPGKNGPTPRAS